MIDQRKDTPVNIRTLSVTEPVRRARPDFAIHRSWITDEIAQDIATCQYTDATAEYVFYAKVLYPDMPLPPLSDDSEWGQFKEYMQTSGRTFIPDKLATYARLKMFFPDSFRELNFDGDIHPVTGQLNTQLREAEERDRPNKQDLQLLGKLFSFGFIAPESVNSLNTTPEYLDKMTKAIQAEIDFCYVNSNTVLTDVTDNMVNLRLVSETHFRQLNIGTWFWERLRSRLGEWEAERLPGFIPAAGTLLLLEADSLTIDPSGVRANFQHSPHHDTAPSVPTQRKF